MYMEKHVLAQKIFTNRLNSLKIEIVFQIKTGKPIIVSTAEMMDLNL